MNKKIKRIRLDKQLSVIIYQKIQNPFLEVLWKEMKTAQKLQHSIIQPGYDIYIFSETSISKLFFNDRNFINQV